MPTLRTYPCSAREPDGRRCAALVPRPGRCPKHETHWDAIRSGFESTSFGDYGGEWPAISRAFLAAHPRCACGAKATETDHLRPKREGGSNDPTNLVARCRRCHVRKTLADIRRRRAS